tara:strand:- start:265 stop:714 length:450 start_codon:yes stop_codon:yes gene_type:complete
MPKTEHDFKNFPELTNRQMEIFYFDSPHKQITEDFRARVVKVIDGDTVRVKWEERSFDFPIRLANLAAPELKESGGVESQKWLAEKILGKDVDIVLSPERVEKWGRLLAYVIDGGINMSEESRMFGMGQSWNERGSFIPNFEIELERFD